MSLMILKDEIKARLDNDPTYREMLFRRGYLLTNATVSLEGYPFYNIWDKVVLGPYSLYVQQKQTYYVKAEDNIFVAIVGHAYNPFDMKWKETELCADLISAYKHGLTDYFDKVSEFTS